MRGEIQARVDRGEEGLDVDYWENVLAELKVHILKNTHAVCWLC